MPGTRSIPARARASRRPARIPAALLWSWNPSPAAWPCRAFSVGGCYTYALSRSGSGRSEWLGSPAPDLEFRHEPLRDLRQLLRAFAGRGRKIEPAQTGWIGYVSYDLGRVLEPAASGPKRAKDDRVWPLIELYRCEAIEPGPPVFHVEQLDGPDAPDGMFHVEHSSQASVAGGFRLGRMTSGTGRQAFVEAAARAIEYIRAGDVFQVNLAHRLTAPFSGSAHGLFQALARRARPWHGAYLRVDGADGTRRAVASMSPELFLGLDAVTRRVTTRPMKGTRPGTADPEELEASSKDRAELNMIIDLMRNDLGRVCRFGSVRVESARTIESHGAAPTTPALWQATGTVAGELRDGLDVCDLLAAAFPPGSVTGAPKVRAMQIIDELEPVPRGPYCGCIGWIGDDGSAAFSVAIRTALITGRAGDRAPDLIEDGVLDYSVGAGIVADSDPEAEWRETLDKAGVLEVGAGER